MYRLPRPNMAVNDPRVSDGTRSRRFQMWNTWDIATTESPEHIVEWIGEVARSARRGRLKNLVLSCHGTAGRLQLGQGFSVENVYLFNQLGGLVQKIWLPDCLVAKGHKGNVFCAAMALGIGGYVVAPTEKQCDRASDVPYDMMTSFEGEILCFGPDGEISWRGQNPSLQVEGGACIPVPD
ncbi:hypothetical protein [Marivita sp.]|uniref:hypothetical protein n=1 Tax=Marivita sp. TaxID=2003365 RepID=UPI003F6C9856